MGQSPVVDVVRAIADSKGIEPDEFDTPLQEYIDTEAIQLLASHDTASWTLSFELPNHNVTVTSDGLILVDGAREEIWA
ncbi:HalOD1 output domain-containing protein [Haloarcula laminariae]|uniref:HalOD1 output domain-containing protein n=1 Tax=Haloarcula laminariae TaxID=2961577 RepID=UPI00387DC5F1